jgi:hypothetical protein
MGMLEKLLVIGLGLLVVLVIQFAPPFKGERPQASAGASGTAATATPRPEGTATPAPAAADVAPTPQPTSAAAQPDPPWFRVTAGGSGANMRGGPSINAPVVQQLSDGTVITNLDQKQTADGLTWQKVALGDTEGWIDAALLAPQRE